VTTVRDNVRTLKASGKCLKDVEAAKPSSAFDAVWGKGGTPPDDFVALVHETVK
jgi:hypothetical protein